MATAKPPPTATRPPTDQSPKRTGSNVGILDKFERSLERGFNGAFAKTFRSGLQPVEISAALKRELDTSSTVISRDRILVPNRFHIELSPSDFDRMSNQGQPLIDEFMRVIEDHAADQGYQFAGGLSIKLVEDETLSEGQINISSRSAQGQVVWTPVFDIAGERIQLGVGSTIIGRGSDADITIDDSGASRRHAEFVWDGRRAGVRDLGSTNGTKLNGRPIRQAAVEPDSVIKIGRTELVFRVIPQSDPGEDTTMMGRPGGIR